MSGPDSERAADRDDLADMICRVIRREQDGAQVRLVTLAGRHFAVRSSMSRASRFNASRERTHDAMLSVQASWLGGAGSFGQ